MPHTPDQDEIVLLRRRVAALENEVRTLKDAKEFLRALFECAPDFILRITPDAKILFCNRYTPGLSADTVVGTSVFDYLDPLSHEAARVAFENVIRTGEPDGYESIGVGADGQKAHYLARVGAIKDGDKVVGLTLIATNIDRLKQAETALKESEEKLRVAVARTGMGLWSWDKLADRVVWDETVCHIFGVPPERAPTTYDEFLALVHPADRKLIKDVIRHQPQIDASLQDHEYRILRADGATRWILRKGGAIRNERGEVVKLLGGILDVTEQRDVQERLRHAQKMEAIGRLSAGIAHNFNNMLASILPNLELAARHASPAAAPMLDGAQEAALRATEIVRKLMLFSRRRPSAESRPGDIGALVQRTFDLCRTMFDLRIAMDLDHAPALPPVAVDAEQMEQALLNILLNARDALTDIGDRPLAILVTIDAAPAGAASHVRIAVRDNGRGMDDETRRRAFEPFFTTKDVGMGTGLGLSTTYAIIQGHGGWIDCDTSPGAGTTITLHLPRAPQAQPIPTKDASPQPRQARARVLVVDDDDLVRKATSAVLRDAGYDVSEAKNGGDAIEIYRAEAERIDVVLLDHCMPRLSGRMVLQELRDIDPGVKVVSFSGYGEVLEGARASLAKPADIDVLLATLRRVIDAR